MTLREVLAATGWRQASVAGIAHQYGLDVRTERTRTFDAATGARTLEARYWGTQTDTPQVHSRRRAGGTVLPGPSRAISTSSPTRSA